MILKVICVTVLVTYISASPIFYQTDIDEVQNVLTEDFWPEHYEITITPYLEAEGDKDEWTFDGAVKIKLNTKLKGLKTITLNANQLIISEVKLYSASNPNASLPISFELLTSSQLLAIHSVSEINQDENYFLEISYMGYLNNEMSGFYRSTYYENGIEKRLSATHFQSYGARRAFPCFDEPKFKAVFHLKIIHKDNYHVLSNTNSLKESILENGRIETIFEGTQLTSSNTVAFIVAEFINELDSDDKSAAVLISSKNNPDKRIPPIWNYIVANHDKISKSFGGYRGLSSLIVDLASHLTKYSQLYALKEYLNSNADELESENTSSALALRTASNRLSKLENRLDSDYRLNKDVLPRHYDITITPYLYAEENKDEWTFDGVVEILIQVTKPGVSSIELNADDMEFINFHVYEVEEPSNNLAESLLFYPHTQKIHVALISELDTSKDYILKIQYSGFMRDDMFGFYRSTYIEDGVEKRIASTQFESTSARRAFPCFDEPEFKATFQVRIRRPESHSSMSNTRIINFTELPELSRIEDIYEITPLMSTYTVAFVVSQFTYNIEGPMSLWSRFDMIENTKYALRVGVDLLEYFDQYTQFPFYSTIDKMDMVAIPDFAPGAMENWGLVTYKESYLLHDEIKGTPASKQNIAQNIAHEFAHQWFGNLVTFEWWSSTWLNEGFAVYHEYFSTAKVETEFQMDLQFIVEEFQTAFYVDSKNVSRPMNQDVNTYSDISGMFDNISYNKGGCIVRMMEHVIGYDKFHAGVRQYLSANAYQSVTPEKLYSALQDQVEDSFNVAEMMSSWTDQEGYPVLEVSFDTPRSVVTLTQRRFILQNPNHSDLIVYHVPITFTTKGENSFENTAPERVMTEKSISLNIDSSDKWTIFNNQMIGFYRVNYDETSWNLIAEALQKSNHDGIHVLNRAQIVDDVLNLARGRILEYEITFSVLQYLDYELNYIPWALALNGLSYISQRFAGPDSNEYFQNYIQKRLYNIYNYLGFYDKESDSHMDKLNRGNILRWACKYELEDCIEKSLEEFEKAKTSDSYLVPGSIREVVYCTALSNGGVNDWNWLWEKYTKEQLSSEQILILKALGCTNDEDVLTTYLDNIFSDTNIIRKQNKNTAFVSTYSGHDKNVYRIWNYIEENHEKMAKALGGYNSLANIIAGLASRFITQSQINALSTFTAEYSEEFGESKNVLLSAISASEYDMFWTVLNTYEIIYQLQRKITIKTSEYRLNNEVLPKHYDLTLTPYLHAEDDKEEWTFDGVSEILVQPTEANVRSITLHANDLDIGIITVFESGDSTDIYRSSSYILETHKLTIYVTIPLDISKEYLVKITYLGYMREDMVGFYKSVYYENGVEKRLGATQFQTTRTRRAFPCFDEPGFKATFQTKIRRLEGYNSISNTKLLTSENVPGTNRIEDTFERTPFMSTYLVAFLVSEFTSRSHWDLGIWARPEMYDQTNYAVEVGTKLLSHFNDFTQYPYYSTIPKMDMAAIPDKGGAMENWGLLTYSEPLLLNDREKTTPLAKQRIAEVIAHEQAHMWFGNLVTCSWWSHAWLNEGFAQYNQFFATAKVELDWDVDLQFVVEQLQDVFQMDSKNFTRPINNEVNTPAEVSGHFDSISYSKGASIIRMIEHLIGSDQFQEAIQQYLVDNQYQSSVPEKLYSALQSKADPNLNIAEIFSSWTDQRGYPVIYVEINEERSEATINQKRFFLEDKNNDPTVYQIPLTYTTKQESNFINTGHKYLLTSLAPMNIPINSEDSWTIFNIQQVGYYRVNYDIASWSLIRVGLLNESHDGIHVLNRAQIVDDSLNLARAGYLSYQKTFDILDYLDNELNYIPWLSAFNGLSYLSQRLVGSDNNFFNKYIIKKMTNIYKYLGFYPKASDTHTDSINRDNILQWICKYGHEECIENARDEFEKAKEHSNHVIPVSIRQVVYCTGVMHGNEDDWDWLWNKFTTEQVATEKVLILNALGCVNNEDVLIKYLDYIFSDRLRRQDRNTAFASTYSGHDGNVDRLWTYIDVHYEQISNSLGGYSGLASLISGLSNRFVRRDQVTKLENFVEDHLIELESSAGTLDSVLRNVNYQLYWDSINLNLIIPILEEKSKDGATVPIFNLILILGGFLFNYFRLI